ncbi:MAG TPA: 16S rRNA (cytidine(1402)-2'-O)-methyltransferase, partial [Lachnospiraceae bacterium]|nr:16S rRNA (cytidine(1402)-2'-O)-methyltransferase [Lachnospiraceae bacterium]
YHEHNKYEKADELVRSMLEGKNVACVTDAGTPGISDPGEVLTAHCIAAGIPVISLPGATAVITALTVSGLPTRRFVFEGFLPRDKKERAAVLEEIGEETRTVVLYEAPHHLKETLEELMAAAGGERRIALCRELTKLHEEILRMTLEEAVSYHSEREARGEYVLVMEGRSKEEIDRQEREQYAELSVEEHMARYIAAGMDRKEAMKAVAADRGVSKREIYKDLLRNN